MNRETFNGCRIAKACECASLAFLALAALMGPTQWSVELAGAHIAPADILLLPAAASFAAAVALRREWRRLAAIPWTAAAFLAWMAMAVCAAEDKAVAAKEFIQCALYFGIALGLFRDAFDRHGRRALAAAAVVFAAAGALSVALAARQYLDFSGETANPALLYFNDYADSLPEGALAFDSWFGHLNVRGAFGNRNVFGGFLALFTPFVFAFALEARRAWLRALAVALAAACCCVNLSGASMLTVAVAVTAMAAAKKRRAVFWTVATVAAVVALAAVVLPRLPRENTWELARSIEPYDPDTGEPARRYPEWQAAVEMTLDAPWTGVGPGAYQRNIGQYYGSVPRASGPAEPDIQNLYLVLASSAGIPAALLFLAMLAEAAAGATASYRAGGEAGEDWLARALFLGSSGAVAAFAAAAIWSPLLVRGLGIPLAMMLAISGTSAGQGGSPTDRRA